MRNSIHIFHLAMAIVIAATAVITIGAASGNQGNKMTTQEKDGPPLVCALNGLTSEQRERQSVLKKRMQKETREVSEMPKGYAFRFDGNADNILMLAEFISLERLCCPFFDFELEVGADKDIVWLRLTGREGVKDFLKAELGLR